MMRNTNQYAWSSSKSSRLTKTATMIEVSSVLAAYIKNQESQKTESWSPIIFRLSLILFSFSNTTRLNKGRRNSDIAIVSNRRKTMARKPPALVTSCFLSELLIICRATGGEAGLWQLLSRTYKHNKNMHKYIPNCSRPNFQSLKALVQAKTCEKN